MASTTPTRRERLREQTLSEIREHAYAQIEQGGATALSLNGVAKAMGMSGAAMYRYFASRDALLSLLVAESYEDLAEALAAAYAGARRRGPQARLRVTLRAYRDWALAQPHRYRLVFESTFASNAGDRRHIVPAAQRAMDVVLRALADTGAPAFAVAPASLSRDLVRWGATTGQPDAGPAQLLLAQRAWTRLHGVVSLEIEGVFVEMGIDPRGLFESEVDGIVADVAGSS